MVKNSQVLAFYKNIEIILLVWNINIELEIEVYTIFTVKAKCHRQLTKHKSLPLHYYYNYF